jgi:WD40 repeat protein
VTGPLAVSIDQRQLLASSYSDEAVAVWKLDGSGPIQRVIAAEEGSVASFGYNSTGSLLNSSKGLYRPSLWDPVTGVMTDPLESITIGTWADAPDRFWAAFAESADTPEGYIFTGGLYDTTTKTRVPNVRIEFGDDNLAVPWNDTAHHRMLLLAADNVRVFDQLGNYIGPTITIDDPGLGINTAQSSADGTKLVISVNGQTYLYDAITGAKLDVPPLPLVASVVSPNGVAVGSTVEGDLWIFDPDTLEKLDELPGLHGFAELLTLSADGTTLAAENESDGIRIYDVPSRTQLGENIPDVDGALGYFAMRPDGLELAIPYGELGLVLWDLDPEHWLDAACALAGRNLSQQEWDKYLGAFGEYHQTCNGDRANR